MPLFSRAPLATRLPPSGRSPGRSRVAALLVALLAVLWLIESHDLAARAATGLVSHPAAGLLVPVVRSAFTLFLLAVGLTLLDRITGRSRPLRALLALPARPTSRQEWFLGAAVGWSAVVISLLPFVLTRSLHSELWLQPPAWAAAVVSLCAAALSTLAIETVFRGFSLGRLTEAIGTSWATLVLAVLYALVVSAALGSTRPFFVSFCFALLLSAAWHRTHALWLAWGLHFSWSVSLGLLFGLRTFDGGDLSSLVQSRILRHSLLIGSGFGPLAAPWTAIVLLLAIAVLLPLTRDFAWHYTHRSIEPGGYPMEAQPPAAHAAMAASAPPPPLVQILSSTPPPPRPVPPGKLP